LPALSSPARITAGCGRPSGWSAQPFSASRSPVSRRTPNRWARRLPVPGDEAPGPAPRGRPDRPSPRVPPDLRAVPGRVPAASAAGVDGPA